MHRVLMQLSFYCISCICKPTNKSKHMYPLLVYNENYIQPIQYITNISGTASLVEAISYIERNTSLQVITKYNFYHVHVWVLTEMEWKRMMKNQRHKNYSEAIEQSKKRILLEKKGRIGQINMSYRWINYKSTKQWTLPRNKIC